MKTLTPGKIRGLSTASNDKGVFTILAVDHRDSMRAVLSPDDPNAIAASDVTAVKMWLLNELGSAATAVMLDPELSAAQAIATRSLPGQVGFLAALEAQGYLGDPSARQTSLLDGWSVEKAKRLGASGIKLLVLYRPDSDVAEVQDQTIAAVIADCQRQDIPLFLEPLAYGTDPSAAPGSSRFASMRPGIVIETVRRLTRLGPDVLKVQFPVDTNYEQDRSVWRDACAELNSVATVPWALLSGGDPYELFREQVEIACRAGASGFMVGRALWQEAVVAPVDQRARLVEKVLRPRFAELAAIANELGADWATRHTLPEIDHHWYLRY